MVNETHLPDHRDQLILQTLRAAKIPVSGQVLAEQLGISRVALWKRIESLKAFSYDIQAGKRGYWLRHDDAVVPWEFPDQLPISYHMETGSTMDEAWALAESGAATGTLVVADRQLEGRGRLHSRWFSPPGGLFMTIVIRAALPASYATSLLMQGACFAAAWLNTEYRCPLRLQWPQSLVLAGQKVGGLLVEMAGTPENPRYFTLGIGIDLHALGLSEPGPLRRLLAAAWRDQLVAWAANPNPQPETWQLYCDWLGKSISIRDWQGQVRTGTALGYDQRAAMLLRDSQTNQNLTIPAGETQSVSHYNFIPGENP